MANDPGAISREVVESFQTLLDGDAQKAIGEHNFHALQEMVREALAEQSEAIFERMEANLKQLKDDMVERRPLEL